MKSQAERVIGMGDFPGSLMQNQETKHHKGEWNTHCWKQGKHISLSIRSFLLTFILPIFSQRPLIFGGLLTNRVNFYSILLVSQYYVCLSFSLDCYIRGESETVSSYTVFLLLTLGLTRYSLNDWRL